MENLTIVTEECPYVNTIFSYEQDYTRMRELIQKELDSISNILPNIQVSIEKIDNIGLDRMTLLDLNTKFISLENNLLKESKNMDKTLEKIKQSKVKAEKSPDNKKKKYEEKITKTVLKENYKLTDAESAYVHFSSMEKSVSNTLNTLITVLTILESPLDAKSIQALKLYIDDRTIDDRLFDLSSDITVYLRENPNAIKDMDLKLKEDYIKIFSLDDQCLNFN